MKLAQKDQEIKKMKEELNALNEMLSKMSCENTPKDEGAQFKI